MYSGRSVYEVTSYSHILHHFAACTVPKARTRQDFMHARSQMGDRPKGRLHNTVYQLRRHLVGASVALGRMHFEFQFKMYAPGR